MAAVATVADRELQIPDLYDLARCDFGTFVELAFPILHPGKKLVHAPYLDVLVALLEGCAAGRKDSRDRQSAAGLHEIDVDLDHVRCLATRRRPDR